MIPLSLGQTVVAYAIAFVGLILLVILARALWRARRMPRPGRGQIQCTLCGTIYEDFSAIPLPPCPHCSRLNERTPPLGP